MIDTGYRVCNALNYHNGSTVAAAMVNHELDYVGAATVVVTAGETLCPWHYHGDSVVA